MIIRLLIDMNLSTEWVAELSSQGYDALHWSNFGDPRAADAVIMAWARANNCADARQWPQRDTSARPKHLAGTHGEARHLSPAAV